MKKNYKWIVAIVLGVMLISTVYYFSFIKKFQNVLNSKKYDFKHEGIDGRDIFKEVFGTIEKDIIQLCYQLNYHSIDELIDNFIKIKDLPISCYCYSLENQLRIDYKGNLLDCHASLYDPYLEKDKLANTILD